MVGKTKIRILRPATARDETGEVRGVPELFRTAWAVKTESGGRENLYASRIVHEHEAVLSIRYIEGLTPDMLVEFDGVRRPIADIVPEGFRKTLHIKVTLRDIDYEAGY